MIGDVRSILLIPHIKIQNANALSSPFTIGFPAMTSWMGAIHALQRKLNIGEFSLLKLKATAIICHDMKLHTFKGKGDFVNSIIIPKRPSFTRKELVKFNAGKAPTFIEESRCNLDVTIVVEHLGTSKDDEDQLLERISRHLNANMKMAGGDILEFKSPNLHRIEDGNEADLRRLTRSLMPGYAIIERRELLVDAMEQGQDAIDALLDYLAVHHTCEPDEDGNVTWSSKRKTAGWIVPIATGFHGITDLGQAKNQRDLETPHRFAESVVTLGEFKMPHRIKSLDEILWRYHVDEEKGLYLCQQSI
jgi:CRISPR-associated protein Csy2